jgi:hypothetical protein
VSNEADSTRRLVEVIESDEEIDLENGRLTCSYYYRSVTLCVIDAVFSIGVRYSSVTAAVGRYCCHYKVPRYRSDKSLIPPRADQEPLATLIDRIEEFGSERFAKDVLENRQRTSTRNGILKGEAVRLFATALRESGVDHLQDVPGHIEDRKLEARIRDIPGQRSKISLHYFFMLAGSDDLIKPDRMIHRYLRRTLDLGSDLPFEKAQRLVVEAASDLKPKYPHLTPRLLDFLIWNREQAGGRPVKPRPEDYDC